MKFDDPVCNGQSISIKLQSLSRLKKALGWLFAELPLRHFWLARFHKTLLGNNTPANIFRLRDPLNAHL
jgi:hypothetical protein